MKFIFDFDDVLFNTSKQSKEHIIAVLEKSGISRSKVEAYWERERLNRFSLKKMLAHFSLDNELYEKILSKYGEFINRELIDVVKRLGKENCYLVTYGDQEFNTAKVESSGIAPLFREIVVVPGSKKEFVEKICAEHKNEEIIFVDDKIYNFKDLDFAKCPNLKTILYDEQGLEKLAAIVSLS